MSDELNLFKNWPSPPPPPEPLDCALARGRSLEEWRRGLTPNQKAAFDSASLDCSASRSQGGRGGFWVAAVAFIAIFSVGDSFRSSTTKTVVQQSIPAPDHALPKHPPASPPPVRQPAPIPLHGTDAELHALLGWYKRHSPISRDERLDLAKKGIHFGGSGDRAHILSAPGFTAQNLSPHERFVMRNEKTCGSGLCP